MMDAATPPLLWDIPPILVLVGHAGVGKTNTALGLAHMLANDGYPTTLADADVVNPYFRASDYTDWLQRSGIRVIAPAAAGTTLDTPSLTGELDAAIEQAALSKMHLILDVGGDDDGATAIGRWANTLSEAHAFVAYAVSAFREPESEEVRVAHALAYLHAIENASHLKVDGILNTSNLGAATTAADVEHGRQFAHAVANAANLPLIATIVPTTAAETMTPARQNNTSSDANLSEVLIPLDRYVAPPWEARARW